jgi:hypothetical protein
MIIMENTFDFYEDVNPNDEAIIDTIGINYNDLNIFDFYEDTNPNDESIIDTVGINYNDLNIFDEDKED